MFRLRNVFLESETVSRPFCPCAWLLRFAPLLPCTDRLRHLPGPLDPTFLSLRCPIQTFDTLNLPERYSGLTPGRLVGCVLCPKALRYRWKRSCYWARCHVCCAPPWLGRDVLIFVDFLLHRQWNSEKQILWSWFLSWSWSWTLNILEVSTSRMCPGIMHIPS